MYTEKIMPLTDRILANVGKVIYNLIEEYFILRILAFIIKRVYHLELSDNDRLFLSGNLAMKSYQIIYFLQCSLLLALLFV